MAFISLRQLLDDAAAPVVLQASRRARSHAGDLMLRRMVEAAVELHPELPACLMAKRYRTAARPSARAA